MKDNKLDTTEMINTAKNAVHRALLHHQALGNEIVFWKDGKLVRERFSQSLFLTKDSNKSSQGTKPNGLCP